MHKITANVPLLHGVFDLEIEDDKITSVTPADTPTDIFAGPALFDIQVNGYGGRTCRLTSEEKIGALSFITRIFRENGVGYWIPTICTASVRELETAFTLCARELAQDPDTARSIPGFHLEGPFLSHAEGPRGAHGLEHVRDPDWDEFQRLQECAGGRIKYVTLAPERAGAPEFIRRCPDSGVVVSMGHTDLDRDDLRRAVDAGASMSTHLGNGAHHMIQRHNNYLWYQLACRETYASFISDGEHLPPECLYCMLRAKGLDRSIITSDAVSLGGMTPGIYGVRGAERELTPEGRINLVGTHNLAGSASNLRECVEKVIRFGKISHRAGWELASSRPAKMLGLSSIGSLAPGKKAGITVYRYNEAKSSITVLETWVDGEKVFDAKTDEPTRLPEKPMDMGV